MGSVCSPGYKALRTVKTFYIVACYGHGEPMPEELTGTTFQDFVNEHDLVVVDFWASWCGPCKLVAPVIEELDEEMDNVAFGKVNVDENQDLARQYSIMSIPTLLVFKGGEMEDMLVGAMEKDVLQEKISHYR